MVTTVLIGGYWAGERSFTWFSGGTVNLNIIYVGKWDSKIKDVLYIYFLFGWYISNWEKGDIFQNINVQNFVWKMIENYIYYQKSNENNTSLIQTTKNYHLFLQALLI